MKRVPCNDYFVLKGSIYLCIATFIRVIVCIYLFVCYRRYMDGYYIITHNTAYGIILTNLTFDIPLFLLLLIFYSVLFSAYKLYLVLQEMLGFSHHAAEM